jgi:hypothetical protein
VLYAPVCYCGFKIIFRSHLHLKVQNWCITNRARPMWFTEWSNWNITGWKWPRDRGVHSANQYISPAVGSHITPHLKGNLTLKLVKHDTFWALCYGILFIIQTVVSNHFLPLQAFLVDIFVYFSVPFPESTNIESHPRRFLPNFSRPLGIYKISVHEEVNPQRRPRGQGWV